MVPVSWKLLPRKFADAPRHIANVPCDICYPKNVPKINQSFQGSEALEDSEKVPEISTGISLKSVCQPLFSWMKDRPNFGAKTEFLKNSQNRGANLQDSL
jgi:hypothetical protein